MRFLMSLHNSGKNNAEVLVEGVHFLEKPLKMSVAVRTSLHGGAAQHLKIVHLALAYGQHIVQIIEQCVLKTDE